MKKLKKFYKKNKLLVNTAAIVFVVGLVILTLITIISNNGKLKEYSTDAYAVKYDKNWKRRKTTKTTIEFKHRSKSKINIEIMSLEEEYKYLESEDLIDELLYSIGLENKEYKLLQKKQSNITRNNYDGYKVLYENKDSQVMAVIAKKSDKVMLFTYEAKNEYFDILLDSVQSIIYNFDIKDEVYKVSNSVKVETSKLAWEENKTLAKSLKKNKSYQIASNNYSVKLSIPSNFQVSNFESTYGYYTFEGLKKGNINLTVNVFTKNIYEYLEKNEEFGTLYSEFKTQRNGKDKSYSKFTETLTKLENSKYESYLYKATYNYKGYSSKSKYENYYLIYELDKNHILLFKLVAVDNTIPKDMIDKIKVSKVENYSSNIEIKTKDNKLIGELKRFNDFKKEKYDLITLKLPTDYKEIDFDHNIYSNRYYGLNYDDVNDIYQYDVKYTLTNTSMALDRVISSVNIITTNGNYQALTSNGTATYNEKQFIVYSGGYNDYGPGYKKNNNDKFHYTYKKVLLHQLSNGGYVVIEIDGNGVEISEEVLNDLTNIDIMIKEY